MPSPERTEPPAPTPNGEAFPEEGEPILFDTNIFVYAAGVPLEEKDPTLRELEAACRAIVLAVGEERLRGVTSLVVLQELLYLFHRWARDRGEPALRESGRQAASAALILMEEVFSPTVEEFQRALGAYDPEREDFNDRLLVEGMRTHGVGWILTADRTFPRVPEIRVLDPRAFARHLREGEG